MVRHGVSPVDFLFPHTWHCTAVYLVIREYISLSAVELASIFAIVFGPLFLVDVGTGIAVVGFTGAVDIAFSG